MNHTNYKLCCNLKVLFKRTEKTHLQLLLYIFLGNISNVVDYTCLYILTDFAGFHYAISIVISFVIGVIINYIINITWIFKKGRYAIYVEIMLIMVISLVGLYFSLLIIYVCVEYANLHYMLSKAISSVVVMFWNFFSRKKLVFKQ